MAAHTLVVLDSSSPPPAFRHPSVTPQKSIDFSSSPGLPEVSSFFRPDTGTNAATPAARSTVPGFTSAGTIWKAAALVAERQNEEGVKSVVARKSPGKLPLPVKKARPERPAEVENQARDRAPSISLPRFDSIPEGSPDQMQPVQARRKPVNRTMNAKDGVGGLKVGEAATKAEDGDDFLQKTAKRAVKSVSIGSEVSTSGELVKRLENFKDLKPLETTSALIERSRNSSISISDSGHGLRDTSPADEIRQESTYFPPSTAPTFRSQKGLPRTAPEAAPEKAAVAHEKTAKDVLSHAQTPVSTLATEAADGLLQHSRKGSVALSEFHYRSPADAPVAGPSEPKSETIKKPRKRTAVKKVAATDGPVKRPRKRFAKSESIILNSDEPDPALADVLHGVKDRDSLIVNNTATVCTTKTKKPPKNSKAGKLADSEMPTESGFGVWSQSVYFDRASVAETVEVGITAESLQNVFAATSDIQAAYVQDSGGSELPRSPRVQRLFPSRRSWTPVKNTYETLDPEVDSSGDSPAPRKSLADLVGGFGYDEQAPHRVRSPVGEPLTKKRRIEIPDESAVMPAQRKIAAGKEKAKRVKAPKKKPQTITDLATKSYRAEEVETPNAQSTVSEFFSAKQDDHVASASTGLKEADASPPTFKKPRKPRAKKVNGEGGPPKKMSKPKKVKVKFNDAAHVPILLSPQQAREKEKGQGFLFGTSSQLALEEDVSYVRDLQIAIQESEAGDGAPSSPKRTRVSVGQAERRLFWSASRDSRGHVIAANGVRRRALVENPRPAVAAADTRAQSETALEPVGPNHLVVVPNETTKHDRYEDESGFLNDPDVSQVVDLCTTSPISVAEEPVPVAPCLQAQPEPVSSAAAIRASVPAPTATVVDDSWMLLDSDDSDSDDQFHAPVAIPICRHLQPSPTQPLRKATSPMRGHSQPRTALTALDSNVAMLAQTSPTKQLRAFASQAPHDGSGKMRGRPPKTITSMSAAALSPKRRGRPLKSASPQKHIIHELPTLSATQPPPSSDFVAIDEISDSASDDHPLKDIVLAKAAPKSPKQKGRPPRASKQSPKTSPSINSFVNLEDISDSDAAKQTPSPGRRKISIKSPVKTLDFSPSAMVYPDLPPILDGKATVKPTDTGWQSISQVLFPQISAVVRSTAPCIEGGELSWWEKILMYDPIVLEDLTGWLVSKGVFVMVRRKVVKGKGKGRKKKGDAEQRDAVEEFECVKEELKGWMVQKWCEEMSICCLWREGLRGGVKVRY